LHNGVPDLFLYDSGGHNRSDWKQSRTLAALGFLLHARFFLHSRWQYARQREVALSAVDDAQAGGVD